MAGKKAHEYEVIFKHLQNNKGELLDKQPITFPFQNHDDVFNIIQLLSEKGLLKDKSQVAQFALGLKLFGDVMMKNRDMDLFSEIQPAFVSFMKKLKGKK
ncbi:DUF3861 domain-containing protein [Parapedobacter soli]|uniref:DUF3861 domain-containing protein n=1 Tax=Parapedobacter soli TaxID=416955 RepID=UPI0021C8EBEE|nr:DUF3861 domain-containing protein [Parapedobacter soli]